MARIASAEVDRRKWLLLMLLCRAAASPEGEVRASHAAIASALGLTRTQAAYLVKSLGSDGELSWRPGWREDGARAENVYRVTPKGLRRLALGHGACAGPGVLGDGLRAASPGLEARKG